MIAELRTRGILTGALDHRIRACTHLDVTSAMVEETISAIRAITAKA
jgi:threonine aldolase